MKHLMLSMNETALKVVVSLRTSYNDLPLKFDIKPTNQCLVIHYSSEEQCNSFVFWFCWLLYVCSPFNYVCVLHFLKQLQNCRILLLLHPVISIQYITGVYLSSYVQQIHRCISVFSDPLPVSLHWPVRQLSSWNIFVFTYLFIKKCMCQFTLNNLRD